jgi:hypothetical protein
MCAPKTDLKSLECTRTCISIPPSRVLSALNFNGGGGGIALNFLAVFAIKAEYIRYASTTFTKTYSVAVPLPGGGTVPPGTYTAQGNMYTALAGPEIRIPIPKVKPFGEVLFGISGTNGYANVNKTISTAAGNPYERWIRSRLRLWSAEGSTSPYQEGFRYDRWRPIMS